MDNTAKKILAGAALAYGGYFAGRVAQNLKLSFKIDQINKKRETLIVANHNLIWLTEALMNNPSDMEAFHKELNERMAFLHIVADY